MARFWCFPTAVKSKSTRYGHTWHWEHSGATGRGKTEKSVFKSFKGEERRSTHIVLFEAKKIMCNVKTVKATMHLSTFNQPFLISKREELVTKKCKRCRESFPSLSFPSFPSLSQIFFLQFLVSNTASKKIDQTNKPEPSWEEERAAPNLVSPHSSQKKEGGTSQAKPSQASLPSTTRIGPTAIFFHIILPEQQRRELFAPILTGQTFFAPGIKTLIVMS